MARGQPSTSEHTMIIFYSGVGYSWSNPEVLLQDEANIMLTFDHSKKTMKPNKRFRKVLKQRKRKLKRKE